MNDFANQNIAGISAFAASTVDTSNVESMVETPLITEKMDNTGALSPTPSLENKTQQHPIVAVKSKQEERRDLFTLVDVVRCLVESRCAGVTNSEYGATYKGSFDVRFDNPDEVTPKTLNALLSKGAVIFFPNDINQYPSLRKYCKHGGGINLSTLCTRKNRPANIGESEWTSLMGMWNAISTVLHVKGIDPIYTVFTEALRSFGYGGPKINRKLGGDLASVQGAQAPMEDVLKKLISLLQGLTK